MKFRDYDNYEVYQDGRIWSYSQKKYLSDVFNVSNRYLTAQS